jgi:hypothetical protein
MDGRADGPTYNPGDLQREMQGKMNFDSGPESIKWSGQGALC